MPRWIEECHERAQAEIRNPKSEVRDKSEYMEITKVKRTKFRAPAPTGFWRFVRVFVAFENRLS
jgi:hypothetical protein